MSSFCHNTSCSAASSIGNASGCESCCESSHCTLFAGAFGRHRTKHCRVWSVVCIPGHFRNSCEMTYTHSLVKYGLQAMKYVPRFTVGLGVRSTIRFVNCCLRDYRHGRLRSIGFSLIHGGRRYLPNGAICKWDKQPSQSLGLSYPDSAT